MIPLSYAQQRLRFMAQMAGSGALYTVPIVVRLSGDVDPVALDQALRDVLGRDEVLRAVLPAIDGQPYQKVLPLDELDWNLARVQVSPADLQRTVEEAAQCGFDLTAEVP